MLFAAPSSSSALAADRAVAEIHSPVPTMRVDFAVMPIRVRVPELNAQSSPGDTLTFSAILRAVWQPFTAVYFTHQSPVSKLFISTAASGACCGLWTAPRGICTETLVAPVDTTRKDGKRDVAIRPYIQMAGSATKPAGF